MDMNVDLTKNKAFYNGVQLPPLPGESMFSVEREGKKKKEYPYAMITPEGIEKVRVS